MGSCRLGGQGVARGWRLLANESPETRVPMVGLGNEVDLDATGDGWALLAPYGTWPHAEGVQRFSRAEADQMVAYFKNGWNRLKRVFVGSPIYRGHPDNRAFANQHTDKTVYGTTADLEAREDGLYFRPVLTDSGAEHVQAGAKFVSPHWLANEVGVEGGRKVYAPIYLVSVGLTPRPNIPTRSLANAELPSMIKELLIKLLAALNHPLANEATDEQINAALTTATGTVESLLQRPEPSALANEQAARAAAETRLAEVTQSLANAQNDLAATLVDQAIGAGNITEAARPLWIGRLQRDFAGERVALANEKGALKTRPHTEKLANAQSGPSAAERFHELVAEALPKCGHDYTLAWQQVKSTAAGGQLYQQMQSGAKA